MPRDPHFIQHLPILPRHLFAPRGDPVCDEALDPGMASLCASKITERRLARVRLLGAEACRLMAMRFKGGRIHRPPGGDTLAIRILRRPLERLERLDLLVGGAKSRVRPGETHQRQVPSQGLDASDFFKAPGPGRKVARHVTNSGAPT
jgi:hypothetical protein